MILIMVALIIVQIVQSEQATQAATDAAQAEARLEEAEAQQTARQLRKEHSRKLAVQRVQFGKAGVIASVGTPLDVLSENAGELEKGAVSLDRFGVNVRAFGKAEVANLKAQQQLNVAGTVLKGAAQIGTSAAAANAAG